MKQKRHEKPKYHKNEYLKLEMESIIEMQKEVRNC